MTTYLFDSIAVEVYNVTWINVTADVKSNPSPTWNRGIMGNRPDDRVGHPGYFTFTLNNSASNSAGLAGYYSPGHANCWSGWTTGLKVRLSFTFEGVTYYKYYGRIKPDGIEVEPGIYGARTVKVTCGDFMWRAMQHELKTLTWAQNQKIGDVVTAVNANMPIAPLAVTGDGVSGGIEIFPTIFDMVYLRTSAMAEYIKAAMSEWAYIYVKGDTTGGETLVVENQATRTNAIVAQINLPSGEMYGYLREDGSSFYLKEDGGKYLREASTQAAIFDGLMSKGMQIDYGKTLANRINSYVYPRKVDATATTVLWSLEKSFVILPSQTITNYRGAYRDPLTGKQCSGIEMVAPVVTVDYLANSAEGGNATNMTAYLTVAAAYGTAEVIYTLQNTHTTQAIWVTKLQARGKGVYTYDSIQSTQDDDVNQAIRGVIPLSLAFKYLSDARKAQLRSTYILSKEADPHMAVENCPIWANTSGMNMYGFLQLEPGLLATFKETQSGINGDYFVMGYSAEIVEGKYVSWTPVLKDDPGFYPVLSSSSGIDTYLNKVYPTNNYGTVTSIQWGNNGVDDIQDSLIKFDLSTIPATATIISATLTLTPLYINVFEVKTLSIHRCLRAWTELGATWNKYDGTNDWGTPGANNTTTDREATTIGMASFASSDTAGVGKDIPLNAAKIQEMINGTITNNGFVLQINSGADVDTYTCASFNHATVAYRPKMTIYYSLP